MDTKLGLRVGRDQKVPLQPTSSHKKTHCWGLSLVLRGEVSCIPGAGEGQVERGPVTTHSLQTLSYARLRRSGLTEWPAGSAISLWNSPLPTSPPTFCSTATPACVSPCSGRPVARMGSLGPMLVILCQWDPAAQPEVQCGGSSLGYVRRCPHRYS